MLDMATLESLPSATLARMGAARTVGDYEAHLYARGEWTPSGTRAERRQQVRECEARIARAKRRGGWRL